MDDFISVAAILGACWFVYWAWQRHGFNHEQNEKDRRYMKSLDDKQGRE